MSNKVKAVLVGSIALIAIGAALTILLLIAMAITTAMVCGESDDTDSKPKSCYVLAIVCGNEVIETVCIQKEFARLPKHSITWRFITCDGSYGERTVTGGNCSVVTGYPCEE